MIFFTKELDKMLENVFMDLPAYAPSQVVDRLRARCDGANTEVIRAKVVEESAYAERLHQLAIGGES